MRRSVPIVAVLLLLVAAIALVVWRTYTEVEPMDEADESGAEQPAVAGVDRGPKFEPLQLGPAIAGRKELLSKAPKLGADDPLVARVLSDRERLGALSASGIVKHDPMGLIAAQEYYTQGVQEVLSTYGPAGYAAIGELAFERFEEGLDALSAPDEPLTEGDPARAAELNAALVAGAWTTSWKALVWVGDFLAVAFDEGLIDPETGALKPEHEELVHLLFRHLWAQQASDAAPLDTLLAPEELAAIRRWQVEVSKAPLEVKLPLMRRLRQTTKGYDFDRAEAILRLQDGDVEGARAALQRARDAAVKRGDDEAAAAIEQELSELEGGR